MPELPVQRIDQRVLDALGIVTPGNYHARLAELVVPVVSIPLGIGSEAALGFNDSETDGDHAFTLGFALNNVAAQYAASQVLNPSGSGQVVYLDSIYCWTSAAESYQLDWYDNELTTLVGQMVNRRRGGSSSAAVVRTQNAAAPFVSATPFARFVSTGVNVPEEFFFDPPLRLDAGQGVVLQNATVNTNLAGTWRARAYLAS